MGGMSWSNPKFLLKVAEELLVSEDALADGEFLKIGVNIRDGKKSYWMFVKDDMPVVEIGKSERSIFKNLTTATIDAYDYTHDIQPVVDKRWCSPQSEISLIVTTAPGVTVGVMLGIVERMSKVGVVLDGYGLWFGGSSDSGWV